MSKMNELSRRLKAVLEEFEMELRLEMAPLTQPKNHENYQFGIRISRSYDWHSKAYKAQIEYNIWSDYNTDKVEGDEPEAVVREFWRRKGWQQEHKAVAFIEVAELEAPEAPAPQAQSDEIAF